MMEGIKEILDKISSYNIFNYLLPGILFTVICKLGLELNLVLENNFLGAFLYYFIGMVVSRVGSVIIEPLLKKIGLLKFADYSKFIKASKADPKIELLSEVNNSYRTIVSLLVLLTGLKLYKHFNFKYWHITHHYSFPILLGLILLLFIVAYKKQTAYITKRINVAA